MGKLNAVFAAAAFTVCLSVLSCGGRAAGSDARKDTVVVAGKNYGEGYILGWMAALILRDATDLKVDDSKIGMGATELLYPALKNGSIDVYPEYSGTIRTVILKREGVERDRKAIWEDCVAGVKSQDGVEAVGPIGFNNTFAISMSKAKADALGITKLSDLVAHPELKLIGDATTWTRPDAYTGMAEFYGIELKKGPMVDTNFFYEALKQGQGDLITAFSTDGKLKTYGLAVLEDDRGYYPWYDALYLVNGEAMKKHPEIGAALSRLVGRIDEATMMSLNEKVDVHKEDPKTVALEWLKSQGLLKK